MAAVTLTDSLCLHGHPQPPVPRRQQLQLVTKILIEQVNMLLDPQIFPPARVNMSAVFRSIFLYYIRGICTDNGARIAAGHFARL